MAEEQTDVYKMVEDKAREFRELFARMDKDKDLYFMKAYQMLRPDDNRPMEDVINVTFNDPTTFAMRSIATLGSAQRQTVVEGRHISDEQCTLIESFIDDMSFSIDDWLVKRGILNLDSFINEQICIRGHIAARSCLRAENKKLIPDVLPLDTRFLVYDLSMKGLKWHAYITSRSKGSIKNEYDKDIQDDSAEVMDFFNGENNLIFISQEERKRQRNPYGYPPVVITQAAAGSWLADSDAYMHRGESIFWADRDLFPEMNRTASIFQTLNVGSFAGAVQYESSAGVRAKKPQKPPWGIYSVTPVERGMGYKPFPVNDIRQAARLFYAILYTRIQQGGLSAIDYGNLTFPLSAGAITRLTASRDQIFLPRIQAKAIFYQQLYKMIINQYQKVGIKAELGAEGYKNQYDPKDLQGDYQIKFRFFTESKEQEIANYSVAQAATPFLSASTIRRNILKVPDPEAEEERIAVEQAEKIDEALFLYNRCSKLIAQDRDIEARILANRLDKVLRARQIVIGTTTETEPGKKLPKGGGRQIIPLLGQGKAGGTVAPEIGAEEEELSKMEREEERVAEEGAEAKQERVG
jgi:hypothetical protein